MAKELNETFIASLAERNHHPKRYPWQAKGEEILAKLPAVLEAMRRV